MKKLILILIVTVSILLFFNASLFNHNFLKIHFLDVGEGDAILIQAQNENVLIDTGNLLSGYKIVDYLKQNKVKKIKYLILTHPDLDHILGAFFILPKFQVQAIYDNGQELKDDDVYRWYDTMVRKKANYAILKKGDKLRLKDINLDILWPANTRQGSFNENSLVIKLGDNNFNCLFAGDINKISEEAILSEKLNLKSNILKIGHHGYSDATSEGFLQAVSPELAIISSGEKAPSDITLDLLKKKKIKIYRTDTDGNIIVTVEQKGLFAIRTEK
jgi:competence protein ComEC